MNVLANSPIKRVSIEAVVLRADGYKENLGVVSNWDRSLLKRLQYKVKRNFRRGANGLFIAAPSIALFEPGITHAELAKLGIVSLLPFFLATFVVDGGEAIVTNRINGAGTNPLNVGWGTGAGTTARTDTTLFTEKDVDLATGTGTRTAGTGSQVTTTDTNDTFQVTATRTATGAGTVTNAGTWDNVTMGSGNLFLKGDFTGIGLAINDSIAFTCKVQVTN